MRSLLRRLLARLRSCWRWADDTAAPARHTATGPAYLGGSVRAELQPDGTLDGVPVPNGVTEGQWLHACEGPHRYATVDQLCGVQTWEGA